MSHQHFCSIAGHFWECEGTAVRLFAKDSEPTPCMCLNHQVSMEEGDHSMCSIELLACLGHRDEQLRRMADSEARDLPHTENATEGTIFVDGDGEPIVGFCLWCNIDFYSMSEVEAHNADEMEACPGFQEFRRSR
jgi:hypothetical protein